MISEILRINGKPTQQPEDDWRGVSWTDSDSLRHTKRYERAVSELTDEDARQLREVGRQLGIPEEELYEGVTTGDSPEEKEEKNDLNPAAK